MANVDAEPESLVDFFPSRLRERRSTSERDQLAERFASVIGKDTIAQLGADMPPLTTTAPPPDPPSWFHSVARAERRRQEPPTSPYIEWKVQPFRLLPAITHHGGHPPYAQDVDCQPDGSMLIQTIINDESSQLETYVFVGCGPILAVFDRAILGVSPRLMYRAWHALSAFGLTSGSHSAGRIGIALYSSKMDGTDWRGEDGNERQAWDSHADGTVFGHNSTGHWVTQYPNTPDEDSSVSIGQLLVEAPMETARRYFAYAYLYSQSDADGMHDNYGSKAGVYFKGSVDTFLARQEEQ
jgi:hypothetical protein